MKRSTLIASLFLIFSLLFLYLTISTVKHNTSPLKKSFTDNVLSKLTHNNTFDDFNELTSYIEKETGTYSIYIKDLNTEKTYTYNDENQYYVASLFKLPVGIAVLKQIDMGNLSLDTKLTYLPSHYADGTGIINKSDYGTEYTVDEILTNLFKYSDNVSQNMLLDLLDVDSTVVSGAFPNAGKTEYYHTNNSSVLEIGEYLEYIYTSDYLSEESKQYLLNIMQNTSFDYLLAQYINSPFSNKIGLWESSIHSCGIVSDKNLIVCVMSLDTNEDTFIKISQMIASFVNTI